MKNGRSHSFPYLEGLDLLNLMKKVMKQEKLG